MAMLHRLASGLSDIGMVLSVLIMVLMVGLTLAEVFARNILGTSTFVMNELVGYGVAAMTMIALGHCLERGTLIRMNLLLVLLPARSLARRLLEIIAVMTALLAGGVALHFFTRNLLRNYERGYVSETAAQIPLWLPESFVVAGLAIFLLQLVSYLVRLLSGAPIIAETHDEALPQDTHA